MTALGSRERATLLAIAREAIESGFRSGSPPPDSHKKDEPGEVEESALTRLGASFVTITIDRMLRGCVGTLEARRPLVEDVAANARAAAFEDSRFATLTGEEFRRMRLEISVLSPSEVIVAGDRGELLESLRPGEDGLVVTSGSYRATFLPQVWKSLPEPDAFVRELVKKAGLSPSVAPPEAEFRRYSVESWSES